MFEENKIKDATVIEALKNTFVEVYGEGDVNVYFAPGRVNLIGEHIDYNGGNVFPCALTLGTYGAMRRREDRKLRFFSVNFPRAGVKESSLDDLVYHEEDGWTAYVKGVVYAYEKHGYKLDTGFDFMCSGTIPNKSGLSSSASLEVLVGTGIMDLYDLKDVDQVHNALYSQYAENKFVGLNCGIMDQFASAMGRSSQAIFLDCASLDYRYAPLELGDSKIVIINTKKSHELTDSAYNERRAQCETAVEILKEKVPTLKALCDLTPEKFETVAYSIEDPVVRRRAKHAVHEDYRTIHALDALERNDLCEFGKLMNESHISLRDDFEVSCKELDVLASLAWSVPGCIGARMTGGGFGGCTVNIVKEDAIDTFIKVVGEGYEKEIGHTADFYVVTAGDGAGKIE